MTNQDYSGYFRDNKERKLQIGCGHNLLPSWLNTDLEPVEGAYHLDATRQFPFDDNTFTRIFSEHMIEHIPLKDGQRLLYEAFRVIQPGGKIRIATPNMELIADLYSGQRTEAQERYASWILNWMNPDVDEPDQVAFVANSIARGWGHQFVYDPKSLSYVLRKAGFTDVARCESGESDDPSLRDLESHGKIIPEEFSRLETFILEARKPSYETSHSRKVAEAWEKYRQTMHMLKTSNGENGETQQAIAALKSLSSDLPVHAELDLLGNLEYAKYLAYEAGSLTGAERKLKLAKSLLLLQEVLDNEPELKEAQIKLGQYLAEI